MSQVAQLRLATFGLLEQPGLRIPRRFMRLIRPLPPVKIDLSGRSSRLPLPVLPPKAPLTGPCLDQCSVHREIFIRHVRLGSFQHPFEKRLRDLLINKFLGPIRVGAVLPVLHLNGYKINNPTLLSRISRDELDSLFRGYGWTPYFVEGSDPPKHAPSNGSWHGTLCLRNPPTSAGSTQERSC